MSAQDNLSPNQFKDHIEVFRGLHNVAPHEVNMNELGMHWSKNPNVATEFAYPEEAGEGHHGTVVSGLVHPKHLESSVKYLNTHGVADSDSSEQEVPVRKGSPVYVKSMTHLNWENEEYEDVKKSGKA